MVGSNQSPSPEIYHGTFLPDGVELVPIGSIKPAPANDKLYRPIDPKDPDIQALAASIRKIGIKEPIVITKDNVVLSGHRRLAAAKIARLKAVPCRREPIMSWDDDFLPLLREHNRQRVKSLDEVLREEIVSSNPDEAYESLLRHRSQAAQIKVEPRAIVGHTHRSEISKAKQPMLDAIKAILERLRKYWPLSDRQRKPKGKSVTASFT